MDGEDRGEAPARPYLLAGVGGVDVATNDRGSAGASTEGMTRRGREKERGGLVGLGPVTVSGLPVLILSALFHLFKIEASKGNI
jgi:hypothetical protein